MVCVLTEHWKAAKENGTNVPHERLTEEVIVQQPGYVYIYLSNDNDQPLEVFFDDFAVTHSLPPMVCVLTEHWKAAKENGTNVPHERLTEEVIVQQPGYVYIYLSPPMVCVLTEHWKAAKENGTNVPHERLTEEVIVQQPGYVYIYLSNDNGQPLEVFFDDFTVTHSHSAIVQADDYYPFGLTFNGYRRENGVANKYKYNGKEEQQETGWYDYGARMYMPDLGRWTAADPAADVAPSHTPFRYAFNNPIIFIDPLTRGLCPHRPHLLELRVLI